MEAKQERRRYSRIHLMAHGRDKTCTVTLSGVVRKAALIDISAGGARLRFSPPPPGSEMKQVVFAVCDLDDGGLLQNLQATVQWRDELEVGLQFRPELKVSVHALQNLVS